ncbi:hypothetical protein [Paenibacillus pseudetheri]|uniref:Uncharacterized protein n=1 Tax=Paenibacillus pseudetheri TaxID=2897682 RepID=A0ABM9BIB2_9BACL|nr:hypothetical protein [Paenibacillus pseudetheri]CAH1058801.1 hypothetical protein PAECIP111894_04987 [Paenibacillus pseudetheri]
METCKMPHCKEAGTHTWALVPVCVEHRRAIKLETKQYYLRNISYQMRTNYMGIMPLIPWSRKE